MSEGAEVRLTALSDGGGCACKIGPGELGPVLAKLPRFEDPDLLVGFSGHDDGAVYRVGKGLAVVSSADFLTPIVDDPFDFGRIAAANALSDIYAMGADPILCLNLVAFSLPNLGSAILERILAGGAEIARQAGAAVGGGHSIVDAKPKYGMAVTGVVDPERMTTNAGGKAGDALYLTKPVGGGLITTAARHDRADPASLHAAIEVMCTLNAGATTKAAAAGATAVTDVTGFGLLGHLHELCLASNLSARLNAEAIPVIEGAAALAEDERCISSGTRRNLAHALEFTRFAPEVTRQSRIIAADAMTSGGLLIGLAPSSTGEAPGTLIGELVDGPPGAMEVV